MDINPREPATYKTVISDKWLVISFLLLTIHHSPLTATAQDPPPSANPQPHTPSSALTELEALKGENLRLRFDSLDKQMRLLQEQYARLMAEQQRTIEQWQQLEAEILAARGAPSGAWVVNWQEKRIQKSEDRSQNQARDPAERESGPAAGSQEQKQ